MQPIPSTDSPLFARASARLFPMIANHRSRNRLVIEIPGGLPIGQILPDLLKVLGWKDFPPGTPVVLETEEGVALPVQQTLEALGITSSDLLYLALLPSVKNSSRVPDLTISNSESTLANERMEHWKMQPRLVTPSGILLVIDAPILSIGRKGKESSPDIDLSEWDFKIVTSRNHAILKKLESGFFLVPKQTTNGTFVNGIEISTGEHQLLLNGDRIQFGFRGPEFIFQKLEK